MDRRLQLAKGVTGISGLAPDEVGCTAGSSGATAAGTGRSGRVDGRTGTGGRRERRKRTETASDNNNAATPNSPARWPAADWVTGRRDGCRTRERELSHLQKGLSHFPIAVIVGDAGAGKSALASAVAQSWRGRTIYVRATDDDLDALVDEARQQLKVGNVGQRTTTEARLIDLAARMNADDVLVVIDDIHHLTGTARVALLAGLATALRSGRLLTTSRKAFAPSGALFDYVELKLQSLDADAARKLGSELDPPYGPSPAFAAIWKQESGPPISMRPAHRGIAEVDSLDATIKGLSADELTVTAFLALAQIPLDRDAIAALLPPPRGYTALRRLVSRMIVETDARERYSVCSALGERVVQTFDSEQRRALHERLAATLRNLNLDLSVRVRESSRHLVRLGDLPRAFQELLGVLESTSAPPADLSASFAAVAFTMARLDLAAQAAERAVRDADDLDARIRAVQILAMIRSCQGRADDAQRLLDELDLFISHPVEKASVACYRAICLFIAGRDRDAASLMPHARALLDAPFPGPRAAAPSAVFAAVMARIGKFDVADRLLRQAERIVEGDSDTLSVVELDLGKALVRWEKGDQIGAVDDLQRVVTKFEQYGHVLGAQTARVWLGGALVTLGRRGEGKRLLDEARASGIASLRAACDQAVARDPVCQLEKDYDPPPRSKRGEWIRHAALAALRAATHDRRHEALVLLAELESATADGGFHLDRAIAGLARAVMETLECRSSEAATAMEAVRRLCAEANIDADLISAMLSVVGDVVLVSETSRKTLRAEHLDLSSVSIVIDARSHELRIRDRIVSLRKRTVLRRLLYALTRKVGRPVSKDDLTEALWSRPYNPIIHDNPLKSNIRHARNILAEAQIEIEFDEPGYRLVAPTGFAFVEPFLL